MVASTTTLTFAESAAVDPHEAIGRRRWRACLAAWAGLAIAALWSAPAAALPSFAQQTGQACAQCHVGAFGPQLTPYGRDFKLLGYIAADGKNKLPPVAAVASGSYTRTAADRAPPPGYSPNDNWAFQSLLLAYAGEVFGGVGALAEGSYDGVHDLWSIGRVDVRRAIDRTVRGKDLVLGVDGNNSPTFEDLWNSSPAFEFNTATSAFAASPSAATLADGKLSGRVAGAGGYGMWDELLYGEASVYTPVSNGLARGLGLATPATADVYTGAWPYWRLALQHDFGHAHYLEVGAYGLQADRYPGGRARFGADRLTDTALDATYQYIADKQNRASIHATWIHEDDHLSASRQLTHTRPADSLDTARADLIYSYANTWTPAAELFETSGSTDPAFFKVPGGDPGYVLELSYTPWGKSQNLVWANARFTIRYVGYQEFNGRTAGASANNTLYFSTKLALAPFGPFVER